jgi:hypothetical protein
MPHDIVGHRRRHSFLRVRIEVHGSGRSRSGTTAGLGPARGGGGRNASRAPWGRTRSRVDGPAAEVYVTGASRRTQAGALARRWESHVVRHARNVFEAAPVVSAGSAGNEKTVVTYGVRPPASRYARGMDERRRRRPRSPCLPAPSRSGNRPPSDGASYRFRRHPGSGRRPRDGMLIAASEETQTGDRRGPRGGPRVRHRHAGGRDRPPQARRPGCGGPVGRRRSDTSTTRPTFLARTGTFGGVQ